MNLFLLLLKILFGKLKLCSLTGALVGVITGTFFGLLLDRNPPSLTLQETVETGMVLALAGWLAAIVLIGVWLRYGARLIALPAFLNAVITSILTVAANDFIRFPPLAAILGMLIGIAVGSVLCSFCPDGRMVRPRNVAHG